MSTPQTTTPRDPVDARIAMLRAEMEASSDRAHKAALQYEIGHVTETELGQEAQAVREYLGAYNVDPTFQPPLAALVRIFERRRSFKNLARLYEAETKSAATPEDRASSLVDRGVLAEDVAGADGATHPELARPLFEQAIAEHPEGAALAALMLERQLLAGGDRVAGAEMIAKRAELVEDPTLKGMLLVELARAREEAGDVDGAIEAARQAATLPTARFRFLEHLERIARRHGRYPEIVAALEGRAALAARAARGDEQTQGSGAFSVQRFADAQRAAAEAAALYRDAARIRTTHLGDGPGALAALGKAIVLRGDDLALVRERMLASELAGDLGGASDDARRLLAVLDAEPGVASSGEIGRRHAAPLHFRIAEEAQGRGDTEGARIALEAALAADPGSAVVTAMLEDLALAGAQPGDGRIEAWIERLTARVDATSEPDGHDGEVRAQLAWRAAHLTASLGADGGEDVGARASALYAKAVEAAHAGRDAIAREWLAASLRLGHPQGARDGARALLAESIDDEERSAILRDLHELERYVLENDEAADAVLDEALRAPAAGAWAPDLARLHAAQTGDLALLARAHRLLAERATDADAAAAHLCAAARAAVRHAAVGGGDLEPAKSALLDAVQRAPGHRYAVALLEEVYRSQGDAEAVVKLLRDAAEADRQGKGEAQLLLAGAAAEAAGDLAVALSTYEEALDRHPDALGPLFALRRIAERTRDDGLLLRVLERLAELEQAAAGGGSGGGGSGGGGSGGGGSGGGGSGGDVSELRPSEPGASPQVGRATLELGEHLQIISGKGELAEPPLRRFFVDGAAAASPDHAAAAALDLVLIGPTAPAALLDGARELVTRAEPASRAVFLRVLGGELLDVAGEPAAAAGIAEQVLALADSEPWGLLTKLRTTWTSARGSVGGEGVGREGAGAGGGGAEEAGGRAKARAEALLALADATRDPQASAELVVHALRAAAFAGFASDDAVIRAADLDATVEGSFAAAIAGFEALTEADDAGERADALARWITHASDVSAKSMRAAHGRALAAAARGDAACEALRGIVESFPDDLASWEALRVAARDAERWPDVVAACDELAKAIAGDLRAQLLEEAAAVLMDQLEDDDAAEPRLRAALEIDGTRPIAYGRLHDLLADRGDDRGLLTLVQSRADRTDDPDQLVPLFYELARLHRSFGDHPNALQALDNLLMLDPEHVGGLALLAELHVQGAAWAEAVKALRALAQAKDVPDSQRRIARLGAADFLDKKLGDPAGALEELQGIDAIGMADRALYERMADLGERAGKIDATLDALAKAAAAAKDPAQRAALERRAGRTWDERLGDEEQAQAAYRRALAAVPTDVEAGTALAALLDAGRRGELSRAFEADVRSALEPDPTDPTLLRALAAAARWRGDNQLVTAVLGVLVATGDATEEEREQLSEDTEVLRRIGPSQRVLSGERLTELAAPGTGGAVLELAQLATETLVELDRLEPSAFGFARGDLVSAKSPPPVAQEIVGVASLLGAPAGDVWIGGKDPQLLSAIASYKGKPAWLAGSAIVAPLATQRRYEIGRWATALRLGIGPLASRGADQAATALFAIASAGGAALPASDGRAGMADAVRAATKAISRRVRKGVPDLVQKMGDGGRPIVSFSAAAQRTFARGGLLVAGDLPGVLELVLGGRTDRERVLASEAALDLVRFWISPAALAARRELGLAS